MNQQITYFILEEIIKIQPMTKLQVALTFIDYSILQETFKEHVGKLGSKGYRVTCLLNALIAKQLEQIVTVKAPVKRLECDPVFSITCGFDPLAKTPSTSTFSSLLQKSQIRMYWKELL